MQFENTQCCTVGGSGVAYEYTLNPCVGVGTFGRVYRAVTTATGVTVAIKVIDSDRARPVQREIDIHAALRTHPNVVRLIDHFHAAAARPGSDGAIAWHVVLEYCDTDLGRLLRARKTLRSDEVRPLVDDLVAALTFLHDQCGIIHRDVKLSNLLLTRRGTLKLADFGLAAELVPGVTHRSFCGTVDFMAPEVFRGLEQGPPRDVWALGCVVYNLLVGKPPFAAATRAEKCERIQKCDYDLDGALDDDVVDFICAVLRSAPADRLALSTLQRHAFLARDAYRSRINVSRAEEAGVALAEADGAPPARATEGAGLLPEPLQVQDRQEQAAAAALPLPTICAPDAEDGIAAWRRCASAADAAVDSVAMPDAALLRAAELVEPQPRSQPPPCSPMPKLSPTAPTTPSPQVSSRLRAAKAVHALALQCEASPDSIADASTTLSAPTPSPRRPASGSTVTLESRGDVDVAASTRWIGTLTVKATSMRLELQYNDSERTHTTLSDEGVGDFVLRGGWSSSSERLSDLGESRVGRRRRRRRGGGGGGEWVFRLRDADSITANPKTLVLASHAMEVLHACLDVERDTIAAQLDFPVRRIVQLE